MSDQEAELTQDLLRVARSLLADLSVPRDVQETLQVVVDGVRRVGFGAAVLNVVRPDGDLEVAAISGPDELRAALSGVVLPRAETEALLALAGPGERLVLTDRRAVAATAPDLPTWYPEAVEPAVAGEGAWQPDDELLAPLHDQAGELLGVLSLGQPLDGRRPDRARRDLLELYAAHAGVAIANARLRSWLDAERTRFRRAFDVAPIGMAIVALDAGGAGRIVRLNGALCDMLGRPEEELVGTEPRDYLHPEDRTPAGLLPGAPLPVAGDRREVYALRARVVRPDGMVRWCAVTAVGDLADADHSIRLVYITDITDSKAREEVLEHAALHDPLTGLLNRRGLAEALVGTASPVHGGTALLYVDLDDFKAVNDTHGHEAGDRVLVEVGRRLGATARLADVVARLGGDEFVVLARGLDEMSALRLSRRLAAAVGQPMDDVVRGVQVSCSVGVAVGGPGSDAAELMRRADRNLLEAKEHRHAGRGYARGRPSAR